MSENLLESGASAVGLLESETHERSAVSTRNAFGPGAFPDTLRGLYEQYCEHEAGELLSLIPQGELRDFLRRASAPSPAGSGADLGIETPAAAPGEPLSHDAALTQVRRYARTILPLPSYEMWVRSYLRNRSAYLDRLGVAAAPKSEEPVMVAIQEFGEGWYAALFLSSRNDGWSGSIHFHRSESARSLRTADIFREEDPTEIRARFLSFDAATLQAFLRSVLP